MTSSFFLFVSLQFFVPPFVWIDVAFWQEISCWHDGCGILTLTLSSYFHKRLDSFRLFVLSFFFDWIFFFLASFNSVFWCHDAACFLWRWRWWRWRGWRRRWRVCAPRPQVLPPLRLLFDAIVVICLLIACPSFCARGHWDGSVFHLWEGVQAPELPVEASLGAPPRLGGHQTPQAHQAPASAAPRRRRHPQSHVVAVTFHFLWSSSVCWYVSCCLSFFSFICLGSCKMFGCEWKKKKQSGKKNKGTMQNRKEQRKSDQKKK